MKTMISIAVIAALAAPVLADMADTLTQKVDQGASSAKGQTDNKASKTSGMISSFGNNALTNAATTQVNGAAASAKGKTDAGAVKVKNAVSKTKAHQQAAKTSAGNTVQQATSAVTGIQNSAAQAIGNLGK